jgi:MFS family permease
MIFYGKIYTFFPTKVVYLFSMAIYETGSIICATASTSLGFILGRAVAGTGAAGMTAGSKM